MIHQNAVPLSPMISLVERYILIKKGVTVTIIPPRNDKELQLLGIAYDVAMTIFY